MTPVPSAGAILPQKPYPPPEHLTFYGRCNLPFNNFHQQHYVSSTKTCSKNGQECRYRINTTTLHTLFCAEVRFWFYYHLQSTKWDRIWAISQQNYIDTFLSLQELGHYFPRSSFVPLLVSKNLFFEYKTELLTTTDFTTRMNSLGGHFSTSFWIWVRLFSF